MTALRIIGMINDNGKYSIFAKREDHIKLLSQRDISEKWMLAISSHFYWGVRTRPSGRDWVERIVPNAETIEAIKAARRGEVQRVKSIKELFEDIDEES